MLIYALLDPDTRDVRYIGKSRCGIKRIRAHCQPSQLKRERTHKTNWISCLLRLGKKPVACVLADSFADDDELCAAEADYIALYKRLGANLTNTLPGGNPGWSGITGERHPRFGKPHTAEVRAHLRLVNLGRKHNDATKRLCAVAASHRQSKEHVARRVRLKSRAVVAFDINLNEVARFVSQRAAAHADMGSEAGISLSVKTGRAVRGIYWRRLEIAHAS